MEDLILDIIYIYIGIFSIYFFLLAIRSLNEKKFKLDNKYAKLAEQSVLCVVLYSHNNTEALKNMLNQLKNQTYPIENFIIQVILDNCSDSFASVLEDNSNIRVLNLNDGVTVGKDQAISILLESLRQDTLINGYVFIDVNRFIENDFLEKANLALTTYPVVTGNTIVIENDNLTFGEKVKICYNKYQNNFIRKARTLFGLSDKIDASFMAIKKDFVEQVDALDLKDINTELKFSLLISGIGYPCAYAPYLKSYINVSSFELSRPSLSYRIKLFKQCFKNIFSLNFKFSEHILSLIAPSGLVVVLLSICYLLFSLKFYFVFGFLGVFTVFSLLLLGFSISILKSELYAKDFLYLIMYPLYSVGHILDNLPPYRFIKKYILKTDKTKKDIQKYSVQVLATNGMKNISCKLDLISENGMARVILTFKNKKFKTSKQIRMVEALNELISKLNDHGLHLKICYCCEYFTSIVDGSKNMIQGECSYPFAGRKIDDEFKTLLWNSCEACKIKKIVSVIEDIRKSNMQDK